MPKVSNPAGRPKGSLNKTGVAAKEAIELAAKGLGGAPRLIEWAKEDKINERVFWSNIYTKLLPLQVSGVDGGAIIVEVMRYTDAVESKDST